MKKKRIWSRFTAAPPPVGVANAWRPFRFWQLAFMFAWTHCTLLSYCTRLVCLRVPARTCLGGKRDKGEHWATEFHYAPWLRAAYDHCWKCMKATAVRNINSRETTLWLCVCVGVWLHNEILHLCLCLHISGCARMHICKPIYMYIFQSSCISCSVSLWSGWGWRCLSCSIVLLVSADPVFPIEDNGDLTGAHSSVCTRVSFSSRTSFNLLAAHALPSARLSQ